MTWKNFKYEGEIVLGKYDGFATVHRTTEDGTLWKEEGTFRNNIRFGLFHVQAFGSDGKLNEASIREYRDGQIVGYTAMLSQKGRFYYGPTRLEAQQKNKSFVHIGMRFAEGRKDELYVGFMETNIGCVSEDQTFSINMKGPGTLLVKPANTVADSSCKRLTGFWSGNYGEDLRRVEAQQRMNAPEYQGALGIMDMGVSKHLLQKIERQVNSIVRGSEETRKMSLFQILTSTGKELERLQLFWDAYEIEKGNSCPKKMVLQRVKKQSCKARAKPEYDEEQSVDEIMTFMFGTPLEAQNKAECLMCLEDSASYYLCNPCSHVAYCEKCLSGVVARFREKCPTCSVELVKGNPFIHHKDWKGKRF